MKQIQTILKTISQIHKSHFVEGVHYFLLKGEELKAFKREVNNIDFANTNAENQVNDIDLVKTEDMNQVNNIDLVDQTRTATIPLDRTRSKSSLQNS